jgi:hypothetical protein
MQAFLQRSSSWIMYFDVDVIKRYLNYPGSSLAAPAVVHVTYPIKREKQWVDCENYETLVSRSNTCWITSLQPPKLLAEVSDRARKMPADQSKKNDERAAAEQRRQDAASVKRTACHCFLCAADALSMVAKRFGS